MISYRVRQNAISKTSQDPIRDYLRSFGIERVESFLGEPPIEDKASPWALNNMLRCVNELHAGFSGDKSFFLIVDSDADGYTSSAIFYNYFKTIFPKARIQWMLHEGKEHGIILDCVPYGCDYVIVPDAGSMQLEQQEELVNRGKTVIIMDHHNVTEVFEHPNVILVNNQNSAQFDNKSLSGAGVVLKVIEAYDETYEPTTIKPSYFYDLAALGILSDCMDITTLDNNYIIYHGLRNINSKIIQAIIMHQQRGFEDLSLPTKIETVFYITPLINGVIREGSQEEKALLFRAFINSPTEDIVASTNIRTGAPRKETFYQYMARTAANIKKRQDDKKIKCFDFLRRRIIEKGLDKNQIVVVTVGNDDAIQTPQPITGLIAMELQKAFGKPCLVLRPKVMEVEGLGMVKTYSGSGRGAAATGFDSFLEYMRNDPACVYAEGHHFAFGAAILADKLDEFLARSNVNLANVDFGSTEYEVECEFNSGDSAYRIAMEFASNAGVFGTGIPMPQIAVTGTIDANKIAVMGSTGSTIKFNFAGVDCIKFNSADIVEFIRLNSRFKVTAICKCAINTWNGRVYPQFKIVAIDLIPMRENKLF